MDAIVSLWERRHQRRPRKGEKFERNTCHLLWGEKIDLPFINLTSNKLKIFVCQTITVSCEAEANWKSRTKSRDNREVERSLTFPRKKEEKKKKRKGRREGSIDGFVGWTTRSFWPDRRDLKIPRHEKMAERRGWEGMDDDYRLAGWKEASLGATPRVISGVNVSDGYLWWLVILS